MGSFSSKCRLRMTTFSSGACCFRCFNCGTPSPFPTEPEQVGLFKVFLCYPILCNGGPFEDDIRSPVQTTCICLALDSYQRSSSSADTSCVSQPRRFNNFRQINQSLNLKSGNACVLISPEARHTWQAQNK